MSNTPEPCDKCKYLYYDCVYEDDPSYDAECTLDLEIGKKDCPRFVEWRAASELKHIPFPECAKTCGAVALLGSGECDSVCPSKFPDEED